jgi:hypothetical protein
MTAFDSPPVGDPNDIPDHLWIAHCRTMIPDRVRKIYKINDISAWTGDDRKTYIANVGPLVCGFTVYQDFDNYNGGIYRHVTGNVRGGHAVLVVGYSDTEGCWICRNSWGDGFGGPPHADGTGGGFFKIAHGDSNIDGEAFHGAQGVITPASANWGGWWPVAGGIAAADSSVFGTSRSTDKLDIFAVGTDHGTYTAAWQPGDTSWKGWWRIQGGTRHVDLGGVAQYRQTRHLLCRHRPSRLHGGVAARRHDVARLVVGGGRHCGAQHVGVRRFAQHRQARHLLRRHRSPRLYGGLAGRRHQLARLVAGGVAAPGTSVFGVSRGPDKLDIFCVGTDLQVYTAAWQAGDTNWRGWWPIGHFKVAPNTSVYAVSRSLDYLDIFAVGEDGGIYSAAWQPGFARWHGWWRILGGAVAPNTIVTAVASSRDHLDIFAVGTDHHIYTAAWQP